MTLYLPDSRRPLTIDEPVVPVPPPTNTVCLDEEELMAILSAKRSGDAVD